MPSQEEIYKLKYLKYKKKYLDLQSKVGAGGVGVAGVAAITAVPAAMVVMKHQNDAKNDAKRRSEENAKRSAEAKRREDERRAKKQEEEAKFNALPQEEKNRILKERQEAAEKRKAEYEHEAEKNRLYRIEYKKAQAEPLVKKINELHANTLNAQCGFSGCRAINSNVEDIRAMIDHIKEEISEDIAKSLINKLNESTEKQKKCNCVTFF